MQTQKNLTIVTGATGAIGFAICKGLAEKNVPVIMVARDEEKARKSKEKIIDSTGNQNIDYVLADLSLQSSIKKIANEIKNPVFTLINNAGATPKQRMETREGIEMMWAVNVLSYFWMMKYFTPHLQKADDARIINVASYWSGGLDLDDPEYKKRSYSNNSAYRASKQADKMLTIAFAKKLEEASIAVNACHPGDVNSNLSNNLGFGGSESSEEGARSSIWLATDAVGRENSGKYFEHMREQSLNYDQAEIDRLFNICESY